MNFLGVINLDQGASEALEILKALIIRSQPCIAAAKSVRLVDVPWYTLIDFELKRDEVYEMSPGEIEAVNEGLEQLKNGQWISHEEANKQIGEWLKK